MSQGPYDRLFIFTMSRGVRWGIVSKLEVRGNRLAAMNAMILARQVAAVTLRQFQRRMHTDRWIRLQFPPRL